MEFLRVKGMFGNWFQWQVFAVPGSTGQFNELTKT